MTRTSVRKRSIFCLAADVRSSGCRRTRCYRQFFTDLADRAFAQGVQRRTQAASAEPKGRSEAPPCAIRPGEIRRLQRENEYLRRRDLSESYEHTLGGTAERYALIDRYAEELPNH